MKDDICLLDNHQKSHYDTITIGPKGLINWVLQLNNSQSANSFNSLLEKHHVSIFPNQPNPNAIQSVIDRGNLRTQNVFLWIKEKRPVHEIDDKRLHKELGSSDRTGKPVKLSEDIRVMHEDSNSLNVEKVPDISGQPGKDTVAVQDDPEVFHEAETLNINDETIRERIEADMDFKIPGLPHSTVKHAQSASVRELTQRNREPSESTCSSTRPTTESII